MIVDIDKAAETFDQQYAKLKKASIEIKGIAGTLTWLKLNAVVVIAVDESEINNEDVQTLRRLR